MGHGAFFPVAWDSQISQFNGHFRKGKRNTEKWGEEREREGRKKGTEGVWLELA